MLITAMLAWYHTVENLAFFSIVAVLVLNAGCSTKPPLQGAEILTLKYRAIGID